MEKQSEISVFKAIRVGQLWIITPCIIMIMVVTRVLDTLCKIYHINQIWGFILGIVLTWLYWAISVVKWRIWAYSKVDNVFDLYLKAINIRLIPPIGSGFEKIEIRTKHQNALINELQKRFHESPKSVMKEDYSTPSSTIIKLKPIWETSAIWSIIGMFPAFYLLFLGFQNEENKLQDNSAIILSLIFLAVCLFYLFSFFKNQNQFKHHEFIVSNEGVTLPQTGVQITWKSVTDYGIDLDSKKENYELIIHYETGEKEWFDDDDSENDDFNTENTEGGAWYPIIDSATIPLYYFKIKIEQLKYLIGLYNFRANGTQRLNL